MTDYKTLAEQTIKDIAIKKEAKKIKDVEAYDRIRETRMKHRRG